MKSIRRALRIVILLPLIGGGGCAPGEKSLKSIPTLSALFVSSVPIQATAGKEWSDVAVKIIDQDLETHTGIDDTVVPKIYTDDGCSSEASGTLVAPEIAMTSGVATITGLKFTPSDPTEADFYAGFTTKTYAYSGCALIPTKLIFPFVSGTGYTTQVSSGGVFAGATRTELPMSAPPLVTSDGAIVVASQSTNDSGGTSLTVLRYKTDGTLDSTFGTSGVFQFQASGTGAAGAAVGTKVDVPIAVFAAATGYYVVGSSKTAGGAIRLVVWKLTDAGALDTSFDSDGFYVWGTAITSAVAATIDAAGTVYVTGQGTGSKLGFWVIDTTTPAVTDYSVLVESVSTGKAIALTGSAGTLRVFIAGQVTASAGGDGAFVAKFKADFTLDSWGPQNSGIAHLDTDQDPADGVQGVSGGVKDSATQLSVLSNGKIIVMGTTHNGVGVAPAGTAMVTWKLLSTGAYDTTFGASGIAIFQDGDYGAARATNANKEDDVRAGFVDAAGLIWIFGSSKNSSGGTTPVIWRLDESGSLDPAWGTASTVGYTLYKAGVAGHAGATNAAKNDAFFGVIQDEWLRMIVLGRANTSAGSSVLWIGRLTTAGAWDL